MQCHHVRIFAGPAIFVISLAATAADVSSGLWETTAQITIPDMAQAERTNVIPITQTRCFRNSDVGNPQQLIPPDSACQLTTSRMDGNTVSWAMQCAGGMAGSGELTFTSDSYQGTFRTTVNGMPLTMSYAGKRIGDCP
jgi:uncharacterized protein DUF3617